MSKNSQERKSFWKTFETRNGRRETNRTLSQYTGIPNFNNEETPEMRGEYSGKTTDFPSADLSPQENQPLATIGEVFDQIGVRIE